MRRTRAYFIVDQAELEAAFMIGAIDEAVFFEAVVIQESTASMRKSVDLTLGILKAHDTGTEAPGNQSNAQYLRVLLQSNQITFTAYATVEDIATAIDGDPNWDAAV